MDRRDTLLALAALSAPPRFAKAQHSAKVYRVGVVLTTSLISEMAGFDPIHPAIRAFVQALRTLGYQEGENLVLERRSAEGRFERFTGILVELVGMKMDAIVTVGDQMTLAAKRVTTTVPIVSLVYVNPVESKLVASLALPGGNITGLVFTPGPEIEGKRIELLKTALPKSRNVAFLGMTADWDDSFGKSIQFAARHFGLTMLHAVHTPTDYTGAFAMIVRERPDALLVANTPSNFANRNLIVDFVSKRRLPAMYSRRDYVDIGGLMSYGTNVLDLWRRAASYIDKILKGNKPGDLPIEQPTKFELIINVKTAKALGITILPELLIRADEVIE